MVVREYVSVFRPCVKSLVADKMALVRLYNALFKRTSTFVLTVVGGVFIFERIFDQGADYIFESINRGVSNNLDLSKLTFVGIGSSKYVKM